MHAQAQAGAGIGRGDQALVPREEVQAALRDLGQDARALPDVWLLLRGATAGGERGAKKSVVARSGVPQKSEVV
jgi:hypothetical protein